VLPVSGTYGVLVLYQDNYQGEYRLRVSVASPPLQMESEANDAIAQANVITLATNGPVRIGSVAGYIQITGNLDYFNLGPILAGQTIYLNTYKPSSSGLEPVVSIYRSDNTYVAESGGGRPFDGVAELRITQSDTYYAVIRGANLSGGLLDQYVLYVQVRPSDSLNFPNLQVTDIGVPTEIGIQSGQNISFSYTVRNVGSFLTPVERWADRVVMSVNTVLGDADDFPLGVFTHVGSLTPNTGYTANQIVRLPDGISGNYHLIVETDAGRIVDEYLLEGDNITASEETFAVSVAPYPDLLVESAHVANAMGQGAFALSWQTANRGSSLTPNSWRERIVIRNLASGITAIDLEMSTTNLLAPGEMVTHSIPFSVAGIGPYQAIIMVDSKNEVFEFNDEGHASAELNNSSQARFDLSLDLQAKDLATIPSSGVQSGNYLTVQWNDFNAGENPTMGSWYDRIVVVNESTTETLVNATVYHHGVNDGAIAAGGSYAHQYSFRLPDGPQGVGVMRITVAADTFDNVREYVAGSNAELNNAATIALTTTEALYSDLAPTAFELISAAVPGRAIQVSYAVENRGEGPAQPSWRDRLYLSSTNVWTAGATPLGSGYESQLVPVGAAYVRTNTATLPVVPQGDYFLILRVDSDQSLYETNEVNNDISIPVRIVDLTTSPVAVLDGGTNQIGSLASLDFAPDGSMLVAAGGSQAYLWSIQDRKYRGSYSEHLAQIDSVDFSPTGDQVLSGARDGSARIWDVTTKQEIRSFPAISGKQNPSAFSVDGALVFVGGGSSSPRIWETMSSNLLCELMGHSGLATALEMSPDGTRAVTGSSDKTAILWDTTTCEPLLLFTNHTHIINSVHFTPGGSNIVTASSDGTIRVWELAEGPPLETMHQGNAVISAAMSRDGQYIVSCDNGWPGMAYLWDADSGDLLKAFSDRGENPATMNGIAFSPDQTVIATTHSDGRIRLWDSGLPPNPLMEVTPLPIGSELPLTLFSHGLYYFEVDAPAAQNIIVTVDARPADVGGGGSSLVASNGRKKGLSEDVQFANKGDKGKKLKKTELALASLTTPPLEFDLAAIRMTATKGRLPSVYEFEEFAQASLSNMVVELPIATTTADKYYILVYSPYLSAGTIDTRIRADFNDFHVSSISPQHGGNAGNATVTVKGTGLTADTAISLLGPSGAISGQTVLYIDTTRRFVTFDLNGAQVGRYSLQAERPGVGTVTLNDAFEVRAGIGPRLEASLDAPQAVRPGRDYTLTLHYANTGDADMAAPLFAVSIAEDRPAIFASQWLAYPGTGIFSPPQPEPEKVAEIQVLALNQDGPPGVIPPGASYTLPLRFTGDRALAQMTFNLEALIADVTPIDWSQMEANLQPADMDPELWAAVFGNFQAAAGITWADYLRLLNDEANLLASSGAASFDHAELLAGAIGRASGGHLRQTLASSQDAYTPSPGLPLTFSRVALSDLAQRFHVGALGRGWSHNYEYYLTQPDASLVRIITPGGGVREFAKAGDGSWLPSLGDQATLEDVSGTGFVLHEKDGLTWLFDITGALVAIEDLNGNRISLTYSGKYLVSISTTSGQSITLQYSASGRIRRVTGYGGQIVDYNYDLSGEHLEEVVSPGNVANQYEYVYAPGQPSNHALRTIIYPDGKHQFYGYDDRGRLAEQCRDGGAERMEYSYDDGGQVSIRNAVGQTTMVQLGDRGQVVSVRDPLGHVSTFNYDAYLNLSRVTGPDGQVSRFSYDQQGNMTQGINPLGQIVGMSYTTGARLGSLTDARNQVTEFEHDESGNLTNIVYADSSAEGFAYNSRGEVITIRNRRGQTITLTRNSLGQITGKLFPDGRTLSYSYDDRGNLTHLIDSIHGEIIMGYDARGLLTKIDYPDGKGFTIEYDSVGRRTRRIGHDGYTLDYGYDAGGRLESLSNSLSQLLVQYSYDAAGRLMREVKGNGTFTTYTYDSVSQVVALTNYASEGVVQSFFNYSYDSNGNRLSMNTDTGITTYEYDALNQLTRVVYPSGRWATYAYDASGNRTEVKTSSTSTSYSANSLNQYTQVGGATLFYDADGNLTNRTDAAGTTTYEYDIQNRLVSIVTPAEGTFRYSYDALGNRVTAIHDTVTNSYLHDPIGLVDVTAEYDSQGLLIARYDHALGLVASTEVGGSRSFYSFDALGSTRHMTDAEGVVINNYEYDAFGELVTSSESTPNAFRFVGRFGTMAAGPNLYFMRSRYFSPNTGSFLSIDPLRRHGSVNLYGYCSNNPLSFTDPLGTEFVKHYSPEEREEALRKLIDTERLTGTEGTVHYLNPTWGLDLWSVRNLEVQSTYGPVDVDWLLTLLSASYTSGLPPSLLYAPGKLIWSFTDIRSIGQHLKAFGNRAELNAILIAELVRAGLTIEEAFELLGILPTSVVRPVDPNDKVAPDGIGPMRAVPVEDPIYYMIRFENLGTAPVQELVVVDYLDPNLDWMTLEFRAISYGDRLIDISPGMVNFTTRDIPPISSVAITGVTQGELAVDLFASFNPQNGRVEWRAVATDTGTEDYPEDALTGFLPHDSELGRNGYLTFSVTPKPDLPVGTGITNKASIVFDFEDPIETPPIWNTIGDLPAALAFSVAYMDGRVLIGSNFTYTVSLTNSGPGVATSIFLTNTLPPGMTLVSVSNSVGNLSVADGELVINVGDLVPGGHSDFTITVMPTNEVSFINVISVGSREGAFYNSNPPAYSISNQSPILSPIPDYVLDVGQSLDITNSAVDLDLPTQQLLFSLDPGAPGGAMIDPTNGVLRWRPTPAQASASYFITTRVSDSGIPSLSSARTFVVRVTDYVEPTLGRTIVRTGESGFVPLNMFSSVGIVGLGFNMNYPSSRLTDFAVGNLAPEIATGYLQALSPTSSGINLSNYLGQTLLGSRQIGLVSFTAIPDQSSGFVPLDISDVVATRFDGTVVTNVAVGGGRVVVIGQEPLLEAFIGANQEPAVVVYGQAGHTYHLLSTESLTEPAIWSTNRTVSLGENLFEVIEGVGSTNRTLFIRAVRE